MAGHALPVPSRGAAGWHVSVVSPSEMPCCPYRKPTDVALSLRARQRLKLRCSEDLAGALQGLSIPVATLAVVQHRQVVQQYREIVIVGDRALFLLWRKIGQASLRQHYFDTVTCARLLADRKQLRRWPRSTVLHRSAKSL